MKFELKKIGRIVELDDKLYTEYSKYDTLTENAFDIAVWTKFNDKNPTEEELSNKELSELCNDVLFSKLKCLSLLSLATFKMGQYVDNSNDPDELKEMDL